MAMNVDYIIDTEEIKAFVQNWFDNNFEGDYSNQINQINQYCKFMSESGYNLLESTNLITIQQHQHILEGRAILPYHTGFHTFYTGRPLIQSILEDKNLAQNHVFYSNPNYLNIRRVMNSIEN